MRGPVSEFRANGDGSNFRSKGTTGGNHTLHSVLSIPTCQMAEIGVASCTANLLGDELLPYHRIRPCLYLYVYSNNQPRTKKYLNPTNPTLL